MKIESKICLPREGFFKKVNVTDRLTLTACASNIITEAAGTADQDPHRTNLLLNFHVQDGADIWSAREHLDRGARALDFSGVSWAGDEQHDPKDLAPSIQGENLDDPGPDPLQMLRGLESPHQRHPTRGDKTLCVTLHQMVDEGDVVSDADTAGEKNDCTVGIKVMDATIRPFSNGKQRDALPFSHVGALIERIREASPSADQEGDCILFQDLKVLLRHHQAFFFGDHFFWLTPGHAEGV